jgi:hypothetical protein
MADRRPTRRCDINLSPLEWSWAKLPSALGDAFGQLREAFARQVLIAKPVVGRRFATHVLPDRRGYLGTQAVALALSNRVEILAARAPGLKSFAAKHAFRHRALLVSMAADSPARLARRRL